MKFIAYTSQEGDKWITALSARLKHREGMFYYSRHLPGMRKKMVLTRRGQTNFFRYYNKGDSDGHTAPESLTHLLCKQVLKELAEEPGGLTTVLNYTEHTEPQPPVTIRIKRAIPEYRVSSGGKNYYIDVLLLFDQPDNHSLLRHEIRWQRRIAVEIWHTSRLASNSPKCFALSSLGIPVIQIKADKGSFLALDEEELLKNFSDDEIKTKIERHCEKLRNTFRKQILCTLLRNSESHDFQLAMELYRQLDDYKQKVEQADEKLGNLQLKHHKLNTDYLDLSARYADILEYHNRLKSEVKTNSPKKMSFLQRFIDKLLNRH